MPTVQYARRVATELLNSKPRAWFWLGDKSSLCWIFDTFLWKTSLVSLFTWAALYLTLLILFAYLLRMGYSSNHLDYQNLQVTLEVES